jgi:hypothetical protein
MSKQARPPITPPMIAGVWVVCVGVPVEDTDIPVVELAAVVF